MAKSDFLEQGSMFKVWSASQSNIKIIPFGKSGNFCLLKFCFYTIKFLKR